MSEKKAPKAPELLTVRPESGYGFTTESVTGTARHDLSIGKAKIGTVKLADYAICPFNLRVRAGGADSTIGGVGIADSYALDPLIDEIIAAGRIVESVMVCSYEGKNMTIRGNRRGEAVRAILNLGNAELVKKVQDLRPDIKNIDEYIGELLAALNKVPALIHGELSQQQIIFLLNDQTSKEYNSFELVKGIVSMFRAGIPYRDVLAQTWQNLWIISGKTASYQQILNAKTTEERATKITAYGEGALRQAVWNAVQLGGEALEQFLLYHAYKNNMVPGFVFEPKILGPLKFWFKRERYVALMRAYNDDARLNLIDAGRSPQVERLMREFATEDSNPKAGAEKDKEFSAVTKKETAMAVHNSLSKDGLQPLYDTFVGLSLNGFQPLSANAQKEADNLLRRVKYLQSFGWYPTLATMADSEFEEVVTKIVG